MVKSIWPQYITVCCNQLFENKLKMKHIFFNINYYTIINVGPLKKVTFIEFILTSFCIKFLVVFNNLFSYHLVTVLINEIKL